MKNIRLLLITCLFYSYNICAQTYVKPRAISWSPNSCNNTVVCEVYGLQGQDFTVMLDPNYDFIQSIGNMDTVNNVCYHEMESTGSDYFSYVISNGYLDYYVTHSSIITDKFNYHISEFDAASHSDSSNGSFIIYFDSLITNYNLIIEQGNYNPPITIIDENTLFIDSIRLEHIQFYIEDPTDLSNYAFFQIYNDNPASLPPVDTLDVGISYHHANSSCSGWINIQPELLTANFYNYWLDGVSNTFIRTDLCPGVYSVYTYAQDINTADYIAGHADTIIITNDDYTYIDTNLFSITPQDTSFYQFENCEFYYSEAIDSITYYEDTVFNSDGLLIVTFDMNIYQGNNFITIHDSLIMVGDSMVLLDVVIYCNTFKSTFKGQRVLFLRGADNHYFISLLGNEQTQPLSEFLIYPNPVKDELIVELPNSQEYFFEIYDQNGRLCSNTKSNPSYLQNRIETIHLDNGVYFLTILGDDIIKQMRFIKASQ